MTNYPTPKPHQPVSWLGGLTPNQFMKRYWQKKPLLVRAAFPSFKAPISIEDVLDLACHDLAEARLVRHQPKGNRWQLSHGPFTPREIPSLGTRHWTVLVQQVNTLLPKADRFLDAFRFIPEARLDDLMISVAGPDGGIGAHVDSYDVFLVQAEGTRRWEISQTDDLSLQDDVPLKLLRHFEPDQAWDLEPGDLLYLPPHVAHKGTAVGLRCMTWSVGFRAPGLPALADLVWSEHLESVAERTWQDPWLTATPTPGEIPQRLMKTLVAEVLAALPQKAEIAPLVAAALSEPAPQAVFQPPKRPDTLATFLKKAGQHGLRLHPASRLLSFEGRFWMNGEALPAAQPKPSQRVWKKLANTRQLNPAECVTLKTPSGTTETLYNVYQSGWIVYHSIVAHAQKAMQDNSSN